MGIGPRILCFFQQSARMRCLMMYLMMSSGCVGDGASVSTGREVSRSMKDSHPNSLTIRALLPRLDDRSVSPLARLALDDEAGDVSLARDGAVGSRIDRAEVLHPVELDGTGWSLMEELLERDLVEGVSTVDGGGCGCALDGSAGRCRERASREVGTKGGFRELRAMARREGRRGRDGSGGGCRRRVEVNVDGWLMRETRARGLVRERGFDVFWWWSWRVGERQLACLWRCAGKGLRGVYRGLDGWDIVVSEVDR